MRSLGAKTERGRLASLGFGFYARSYAIEEMKRFLCLSYLALMPTIIICASCQKPEHNLPKSATGAAANEAYMDWANQLDYQLDFPVQMHINYAIGAQADGAQLQMEEGVAFDIDFKMDILLESPTHARLWGSALLEMQAMGEQKPIDLSFEIVNDLNGISILLDDHGFMESELGTALPPAYHLSQGTIEELGGLYAKLLEAMAQQYGAQLEEAWASIEGVGDLMHPVSFTRFILEAQTMEVYGWELDGDSIHMKGRLNERAKELMGLQMGDLESAGLPFDSSLFTEIDFEMTIDRNTGSLQTYRQTVDMPMDIPVPQAPSGILTTDLKLVAFMQEVPISDNAPEVLLPSPDKVMDLDEFIIGLLPAMEVAMEMQIKQLQSAEDEKDSQQDFSF